MATLRVTDPADPLDLAEIAAHQRFVRALARSLAADRAGADDLAQETWVRLLERTPARPRRLRAWLSRVVANLARDRRRGEIRRAAREESWPAAPPELSTVERVQRMELHRRLVELVLALDPPSREIVLLHHFDGLTVAQAAERTRVPFETARTRLRRALATLRERVERELGGRDAALAALLPIAHMTLPHAAPGTTAGAAAGPAAAATLLGIPLVMTSTSKLSLAAASLLALGGLLLWTARDQAGANDVGVANLERTDDLPPPARVEAEEPAPAPAAAEREPVPAPAAASESGPLSAALGALRITTVWQESGEPAPRVHVRLSRREEEATFPPVRRERTDEHGTLLLRDVEPGALEVAAAGFAAGAADAEAGARIVAVAGGATCEVRLELPRSRPVVGEVVDGAGRPIAGAGIWVSDRASSFSDGTVATESDGRGRFELPALGWMHFLAASAPGYAMSAALSPTSMRSDPRAPVRIVLSPAASLRGRVADPDGEPAIGALVVVDLEAGSSALIASGIEERPPPRVVRADDEGCFEIDSLAPGPIVIAAFARGYCPAPEKLTLAPGAAADVDLVLKHGATVAGRVVDRGGAVVPAASIEATSWIGGRLFLLAVARSTSAADGAFELAGLAPGGLLIDVDAGAAGAARLPLQVAEGEVVRRDVVVSRDTSIRGRVVDESGRPIAGARLHAEPVVGFAPRLPAPVTTDGEGRFELVDCADLDWCITLFQAADAPFALLRREPVRPGGDEFVLVVGAAERPSASVLGRLLDPDGRPVAALVNVHQEGGNTILTQRSADDGSFRSGPWPPGRYHFWATAEGFPQLGLGPLDLAAGQALDVGERRFVRSAALVVRAVRGDGGAAAAADVALRSAGGRAPIALVQAGAELHAPDLAPGDYVLEVVGRGLALQQIAVTCRPGESTTLDVRLGSGVTRKFAFRRADRLPLGGAVHWIACDPGGRELRGSLDAARDAESAPLAVCLAPGAWTLSATSADGARGSIAFAATLRDESPLEVVLDR